MRAEAAPCTWPWAGAAWDSRRRFQIPSLGFTCTALGRGEDTGQAANTGNSHWECASARGSSSKGSPELQIAVLSLRNVKNKFKKVEDGVWTAAASPKGTIPTGTEDPSPHRAPK